MPADESPRPPKRRSETTIAVEPSGRWERFDEDVTPAPVEPEAALAWERLRGRVTDLQLLAARLVPSLDGLARRVEQLETKDAEMQRSLISVEKTQAVQTSMLSTIERGITDIKTARDSDGARFRHVVQIIASIAAIAVSVIAIATR